MNKYNLHIDGIIYSLQKHGGISTVFNEIISRLPKNFFILSLNKKNNFNLLNNTPNVILRERILERYLDVKLENNFNLFHSTYYRLPANKNVKIIQTAHDFIYEKFGFGLKKNIHFIQKKRAIINSDIIICVSNNTKQDLVNFYGSSFEEKCVVIHNAASSCYFPINSLIKTNQILFIGKRSGYKNFKSAVIALSILNDFKLAVIGEKFTLDEINLLQKYIPGRYINLGHLTNSQINFQYNISFCLVYPSIYEGFGIPILEAMQAGCPVIAINNSSIPEIIDDPSLLIEEATPDNIAKKIIDLCVDQLRSQHINYGLNRSIFFNWDKTYFKTKNIYNNLL